MRGRRETRRAPVLAVLAGVALGLLLPGSGSAGPHGKAALGSEQATLGTKSHAVLLSLYSLDTQLTQARARLASLRSQAAQVRAEQQRLAHGQRIARDAWKKSVEALSARLRDLYEQGEPNSLGVLLGATSIDDALARIDTLEQTARLNNETVAQTHTAQRLLAKLQRNLAARAAQLQALEAQAEASASALERTRAQRVAYLASLERQRTLNRHAIARLDAAAQRSADKSQAVTAPSAPAAASPASPAVSAPVGAGQTMTVSSTGYSLSGTTATGVPVGWGIVAVDPSVIPLGTRMTIPGYGEGVAADTGSAVRGATIDLWFPTLAQAMTWGRRTVVITLH